MVRLNALVWYIPFFDRFQCPLLYFQDAKYISAAGSTSNHLLLRLQCTFSAHRSRSIPFNIHRNALIGLERKCVKSESNSIDLAAIFLSSRNFIAEKDSFLESTKTISRFRFLEGIFRRFFDFRLPVVHRSGCVYARNPLFRLLFLRHNF